MDSPPHYVHYSLTKYTLKIGRLAENDSMSDWLMRVLQILVIHTAHSSFVFTKRTLNTILTIGPIKRNIKFACHFNDTYFLLHLVSSTFKNSSLKSSVYGWKLSVYFSSRKRCERKRLLSVAFYGIWFMTNDSQRVLFSW